MISCTQAGDLDCLKKRAVPLCNLQLQQEGGTAPWKKALVSTPAPCADITQRELTWMSRTSDSAIARAASRAFQRYLKVLILSTRAEVTLISVRLRLDHPAHRSSCRRALRR